MKVTILTENQTSHSHHHVCQSEWGLSCWVEVDGTSVLFDTGHTDLYWKNALALGIDLNQADYVVLSHHHWDHTEGLLYHQFSSRKKLLCHPALIPKLEARVAEKVASDFDLITYTEPYAINQSCHFLAEIPRVTSFEAGTYKDDRMLDDTALAITTPSGVFVLAGCAHAGICNICEYSKKITGQTLASVMGGFHLRSDNQTVVDQTMAYFEREKPSSLYPMHCVDFPVMVRFHELFKVQKLGAGDTIEIATV